MKKLLTIFALLTAVSLSAVTKNTRSTKNSRAILNEIEKLHIQIKDCTNMIELTNLSIDAQELQERIKESPSLQTKAQTMVDQANAKLQNMMNNFTNPQAVTKAATPKATS